MQRDMERLMDLIFTWWADQPKGTPMPPFVQEATELDRSTAEHNVGLIFHPETKTLTVQTDTDLLVIKGFIPSNDGQAYLTQLTPVGQEQLIKKLVAYIKLAA